MNSVQNVLAAAAAAAAATTTKTTTNIYIIQTMTVKSNVNI